MSFTQYLKTIAVGTDEHGGLTEASAHDLFSAMLDGGVPDLELGALLASLALRHETAEELIGFQRATAERVYALEVPGERLRPVVIPAYGGARESPNLLPLLAFLLQRLGIPVLVHGTLEGGGRVAAAYVLRELGVMPSVNLRAAQSALAEDGLAFVPTAVLCPGLAELLALKGRLGMRSSAHVIAKLIDPFGVDAVRLVGASSPERLEVLADVLVATGAHAVLLRSTEGEPVASAVHRPRIDHIAEGSRQLLFEEELGAGKAVHGLLLAVDAPATAAWIRRALAAETPLPHPVVNQLACCLYACGYSDNMNQAKAIAAVETGGLSSGSPLRPGGGRIVPAAPH
jgi:anthranilate phosphoribosyltransferase